MFVACGIWCLADVSSVSPSSEQTGEMWANQQTIFLNLINSVLTLSFLLYVLHFRFILSAVKRY